MSPAKVLLCYLESSIMYLSILSTYLYKQYGGGLIVYDWNNIFRGPVIVWEEHCCALTTDNTHSYITKSQKDGSIGWKKENLR